MTQHFNIAIIGTGPGGYVAALKAGQMGASVAVIEKGSVGGTCLNVGCIPSKALLASAQMMHEINHAGELGISLPGPATFDWTKIQARKDKILRTLQGGIKHLFGARKVTLLEGRAMLAGPGQIAIAKEGAPAQQISADKIILAVGSTPAVIPDWPADRSLISTSDEALYWKDLPRRLLIVGGGIIGCEFACMMQAFGVDVTVIEMMTRIMPELDAAVGETMGKIFAKRGIKCFTGAKVQEMSAAAGGAKALLSNGQTVEADRVLVAVGRRPNTANLGLETVGLATDRGFVRVNDFMETPVKGIYCIGDANGRCLLAHAASAHGVAAVENALGHPTAFTAPIPSCVYTFPEVASVGLREDQAKAKGIPLAIGQFPIGHLGKAMAVADTEGFAKVLRHRETGELVGVHMLGHNVTEVIAAAGAMMHKKVTVRELADVVFSHPTISEAIKEAAEDALGQGLHLPPRKVVRIAEG